ncbi:hypothetical protein ACEE74_11710 [Streptococcus orisratti]
MNNMLLYMNVKKHIDKQIEDAKAIGKDINTVVFSKPVYTKFVKDLKAGNYDVPSDNILKYEGLDVVTLNRNDIILLVG